MIKRIYNNITKAPISTIFGITATLFITIGFFTGKISETGLLALIPSLWTIFSDLLKENKKE